MVTIAQNLFYHVAVDLGQNRVHLTIIGNWDRQKELEQYLAHLQEAFGLMRPAFTILVDIREMGDCTASAQQIHLAGHNMAQQAGVHQIAEVHAPNSPGSEISLVLARESNIPLNIFDTPADALAWLSDLQA